MCIIQAIALNQRDNTSPSQVSAPKGAIHWTSVLQLGFSLLGALALWSVAALLAVGGFVQQYLPEGAPDEVLPYFLLAAGAALCGFLLLPGVVYAFRRLSGLPPKPLVRLPLWLRPTLLIFALPLLLLLGNWVYARGQLAWLLLPPVHALSVGLPILWFVHLALRDLSAGSSQRRWGVFSVGLVLAPAVSFFFEILFALALFLVWSFWVSARPDLMNEFTDLVQRLEQARISSEELLEILKPYIAQPAVIFASLAYFSLLVPLVEEFSKSLGVWFLANRNLSPPGGFAAGVLGGAGFALAESLALTSTGAGWALAVFTRIGTGVVHILASGLLGWALARAWGQGNYLHLGAAYLLAVLFHGTWNTLSVLLVLSYLPGVLNDVDLGFLSAIQGELIPYALALLALLAFLSILAMNRTLYRQSEIQSSSADVV